jgi:hypothetical protein
MATYKKFPFELINKGLVQRYAIDVPPDPHTYRNMMNLVSRQENSLSSRYGTQSITNDGTNDTPLADLNIHTLTRLKTSNQTYRYAGAGTNLYRRTGDTNGPYNQINGATPLSGQRFSSQTYRPNFSSTPYIFIADQAQMLKDNGSLLPVQRWGGYAPQTPPSAAVTSPLLDTINLCEDETQWTPANFTGALINVTVVNTTLGTAVSAGTLATVTPAAMTNILPNMVVQIGGANPESVFVIEITTTTFTAFFTKAHITSDAVTDNGVGGEIVATTSPLTATMTRTVALDLDTFPGGISVQDTDLISIFFGIDVPANVSEVRLYFDVGGASPFENYYWTPILQASELAVQTTSLTVATATRGSFMAVGQAGQPTHDWSNVQAVQVAFLVNPSSTTNIVINDLILFGGSGPDVTGGVGYDYRITYFNINTGWESSPSSVWVSDRFVFPVRQPVLVSIPDRTVNPPAGEVPAVGLNNDPQITHVRIYRRGGTIPSNWYLVAQVPDPPSAGAFTYEDSLSDADAVIAQILQLDNDPPVTSLLPTPVNAAFNGSFGPTAPGSNWTVVTVAASPGTTGMSAGQYITIDVGQNQESSIVVSVSPDGLHFACYLQLPHASGTLVTASSTVGQPVNLCLAAFNQMYLAGDKNNPHYLYYSKVNNPEAFPPQNFIEVGTPSDPIMGLAAFNSQIFVFTLTTVYNVVPPGTLGTTVPTPVNTRAMHGLFGNFAIAVTEDSIQYESHDGLYAFQSGAGQLLSEIIDWIPNGITLGDIPPFDTSQRSQVLVAYANRSTYYSYIDNFGTRRRIIWSNTYKRWRPDDEQVTAMYFEQDTATFLVAKNNGMIYQDGVGDYDAGSLVNGNLTKIPINIFLKTNSDNQGLPNNPKLYNEPTLDIDTAGQELTLTLLFDNQITPVSLGTFSSTGRNQVQFKLNGGNGQESLNVALEITGAVTEAVTIYDAFIKAVVDAELRLSWDSFFVDLGTAEWKIMKQGYFLVNVPDPAGLTVNVYLENSDVAAFTFNIPQTNGKVSTWIRFPATKFKLIRFVGTSPTAFQLYSDSFIEWKPCAVGKSYQKWQAVEEVVLASA